MRRAALAVTALAVAWMLSGGGDTKRSASSAADRPGATAPVEKRTLVDREIVDGTLGYAGARAVTHRLESGGGPSARGSGTVTAIARPGAVVKAGGVLYRVDGRPVFLMYGRVPAYRRLAEGVSAGSDVRQLEQSLVTLGFGAGVDVDDEFTDATSAAVERWQEANGMRATGAIELGRVVYLPGPRRIGGRKVSLGSALAAGAEVLETTSTRRVVKIELDVAKQSLVRRGAGVVVTLPSGAAVKGKVVSVGRAAREKGGSGEGGEGGGTGDGGSEDKELVIDVSVSLLSKRGLSGLDEAPVSVGLASETSRGVLAVPVTALLARKGGGYALELVRGGRGRLVRVKTGMFAGGYVQVSGRGLREGIRVGVAE